MKKYEVVYRNEFMAEDEVQARALALQDIEVEIAALQVYRIKELGGDLSQDEIDTLLSKRSGGMFSDGSVSVDTYGGGDE